MKESLQIRKVGAAFNSFIIFLPPVTNCEVSSKSIFSFSNERKIDCEFVMGIVCKRGNKGQSVHEIAKTIYLRPPVIQSTIARALICILK